MLRSYLFQLKNIKDFKKNGTFICEKALKPTKEKHLFFTNKMNAWRASIRLL